MYFCFSTLVLVPFTPDPYEMLATHPASDTRVLLMRLHRLHEALRANLMTAFDLCVGELMTNIARVGLDLHELVDLLSERQLPIPFLGTSKDPLPPDEILEALEKSLRIIVRQEHSIYIITVGHLDLRLDHKAAAIVALPEADVYRDLVDHDLVWECEPLVRKQLVKAHRYLQQTR
jgi:hypothetical protein